MRKQGQLTFYDSVTGKPLFIAPKNRTVDEFLAESKEIGWPSFTYEECVWKNVKIIGDGELISEAGTHLGHNLSLQLASEEKISRYCANLVSIAGPEPELEVVASAEVSA